jgi:hypothetical protein
MHKDRRQTQKIDLLLWPLILLAWIGRFCIQFLLSLGGKIVGWADDRRQQFQHWIALKLERRKIRRRRWWRKHDPLRFLDSWFEQRRIRAQQWRRWGRGIGVGFLSFLLVLQATGILMSFVHSDDSG